MYVQVTHGSPQELPKGVLRACLTLLLPTDEGGEPVMCAHVHGGRRGTTSDRADTVLLQAVQGPGPTRTRREHHVRVQGQRGHLPPGKVAGLGIQDGQFLIVAFPCCVGYIHFSCSEPLMFHFQFILENYEGSIFKR